jgi:hypothetical protein
MVMRKCFHFTTYTSLTESRDNMKPLLIAIFLLATACAEEPEVFSGPYLTRDGVLFDQETNQPITGIALRHYDSGELMAKTEYLSGLRHGVNKEFYLDGQLARLETYQSGLLHGSTETFSKYGVLVVSRNYSMGLRADQNGNLLTGLVEEKTEGTAIDKRRFKDGLQDGYGGRYIGSWQWKDWCYRAGEYLEPDDPYCDATRDNM